MTFIEIIRKLIADAATQREHDQDTKNNQLAAIEAIVMSDQSSGKPPGVGPYIEHPLHKKAVGEHAKFLADYIKKQDNRNEPITIGFGDSLLDFPRDKMTSIKSEFNNALAGSVSHQMKQMAEDLYIYYKMCNVKHVVVGCLLGNALLAYQDVQASIDQAIQCLNKIRELFPLARIIVYMLPPTYNQWVNQNKIVCEGALVNWVAGDINAVAVSFSKMGGFLGIFPRIKYSRDGVHFSPDGIYEFDMLIERAKREKPHQLIS